MRSPQPPRVLVASDLVPIDHRSAVTKDLYKRFKKAVQEIQRKEGRARRQLKRGPSWGLSYYNRDIHQVFYNRDIHQSMGSLHYGH